MYISDVIDGLRLCARVKGIEGRRYLIAGPDPIQVRNLVKIIAQELGIEHRFGTMPAAPFRAFKAVTEAMYRYSGKEFPYANRYNLFLSDKVFDITKARNELGYRPMVPVQEAIRHTVKWYREERLRHVAGGAEIATLSLRDELRKRGHDARLFSSSARAGEGFSHADYECFGTTSLFRTLLQTANPWAYRRLANVLARFKPDVIHVTMFLTQLSPLILPLLRKVPSLYHVVWYRPICPIGTKLLSDGSACNVPLGTRLSSSSLSTDPGLAPIDAADETVVAMARCFQSCRRRQRDGAKSAARGWDYSR